MKPGYKTTEFWLACVVVGVAAATALLQVWRGQLDAAAAVALVSGAVASAGYAHGRSAAKGAAEKAP